jgi:hypothetical protein
MILTGLPIHVSSDSSVVSGQWSVVSGQSFVVNWWLFDFELTTDH